MIEQDEELLLKDLCARLPYGVKYRTIGSDFAFTLKWIDELNRLDGDVRLENAKIFLRPMSSMTESERKEFDDFCVIDEDVWMGNHKVGFPKQARIMSKCVDWLNKKMFDFRGLIPKGLAIEVTEEFNPYKN